MGRATRWLKSLLAGKKEQNAAVSGGDERLEKRRWSFGKVVRDSSDKGARVRATSAEEAAWLSSLYDETEREEQSKHAVAVAAATAAAADAAFAAAQAAVAVVRLTSKRRGSLFSVHERLAAVKIQTVFRGFLAKKALRALKALVKLQALIRGDLVRKKAAKALHRMQALIRAQSTLRSQKSGNLDRRFPAEIRPRRSLERFDDTRSEHMASLNSRRLSASIDRSPKIVEIDTGRPRSRSSRRTTSPSRFDPDDDPPANSVTPARITIPECRDHDWCHLRTGEKTRFASTAQSTPRYAGPSTPASKSVIATDREFMRFMSAPGYRNYMSNTESFDAKVRSQSTPKQRPEILRISKRRVPLREMMAESRLSLSGVGRSKDAIDFRRAVVGRIDESLEMSRDEEFEYYLQRKW